MKIEDSEVNGSNNITIEAHGVTVGEASKERIRRGAQAIFRRYPNLLGIRAGLKLESAKRTLRNYALRVRLELPGYDEIVEKKGADRNTLISEVLEVAERQLRRRARARLTERRSRRSEFVPGFINERIDMKLNS